MPKTDKPERRAIALYLIINLLLTLGLGTPVAAIANHLLGREGFSNGRFALLLLACGAVGLVLTLPLLPRLRRHIERGDRERAERVERRRAERARRK